MLAGVDRAHMGFLRGITLNAVGLDGLEVPLEALGGRETCLGFSSHGVILRHDVPVG